MGLRPSKVIPYISPDQQIESITNRLIDNGEFDKYMEMNLIYKDNLEALIDSLKCFICMTNYINLTPSCGHMGICDKCYRNKNFRYRHNCPICKRHVSYVDIILPFSEDTIKIDKLKLIKIIENVNTKNIKDDKISKKLKNMKFELENRDDLSEKFKRVKVENHRLKTQYNKLTKLNDILKNKVNIRYQKSLKLKSKLKPKTNNYVIQDI
jgi:hypothetical protein